MSNDIIYEDIFEAIRHLEQNNQIIRMKDNNETMKLNDFQYEIMEMNDKSCIIIPKFLQFNYYRGEPSDLYPECFATIYRFCIVNFVVYFIKKMLQNVVMCDNII